MSASQQATSYVDLEDGLVSGFGWAEKNSGSPVTVTYSLPAESRNWELDLTTLASWLVLSSSSQPTLAEALAQGSNDANVKLQLLESASAPGDIHLTFSQAGDQLNQASAPLLLNITDSDVTYTASLSTTTEDNTYTLNTLNEYKVLWDAGGIDTLDLSNQLTGAWVDLAAGTLSHIGQTQATPQSEVSTASFNVGIAQGTQIENVIGTRFSDQLHGNQLDNQMQGGAGNDWLYGKGGVDTATFSGNFAAYQFEGSSQILTVNGPDGTDILSEFEILRFDDQLVSVEQALNNTPLPALPARPDEVNLTPAENETAWFLLQLQSPLTTTAQVNFSTRSGTAIAGEDFYATSGVAEIKPGETSTLIGVVLIDDNQAEDDETFSLVVTDPIGGTFADGVVELTATRTIIDNDFA